MKLWLILQDKNNDYDTYSGAVVVAANEAEARIIHPNGRMIWSHDKGCWEDPDGKTYSSGLGTWVAFNDVYAEEIGEALPTLREGEVVCASFDAG